MSILYIALPIALLIAGAGLAAFLWSVRTGQFDDLETPARRILLEDDPVPGTRCDAVSHASGVGAINRPTPPSR